jgi:hypothetical protein
MVSSLVDLPAMPLGAAAVVRMESVRRWGPPGWTVNSRVAALKEPSAYS